MRAVPVVLLLWASVAGAMELSGEITVDSTRYGRLLADAHSARIAHGGGVSLLVWSDERRGERNAFYGTGPDIYATRIDANGNVLDPAGIPLCTASHSQEAPSVSWDGTQFIVVWADYRDDRHFAIYGARVRPDGTIASEPDGFRISAPIPAVDGEWEDAPQVASLPGLSLVVWQRHTRRTYDHDILGARIQSDGTELDPTPRVLVSMTGNQAGPSVVAGDTGFLVAWSDGRHQSGETLEWDVYATRVSTEGTVQDPSGIPVSVLPSSGQVRPNLVFDGTNYVAVWQDGRDASSYGVYYAGRLSTAGAPLDGTGVRITPNDYAYKQGPVIAFDGTNTWVTWKANTNSFDDRLYGMRFGKDGRVVDSAGIPLITYESDKILNDLIFENGRLRAVWTDYSESSYGPKSARFETDGRAVDGTGTFLAWGANRQGQPALAVSDGGALLVWLDMQPLPVGSRVKAQRLDTGGQPMGSVLELASSTGATATAVGAAGDTYLVAWAEGYSPYLRIRAQRVRADGTVLDAQPLLLAENTGSGPAAVASDGTNFFVIWEASNRISGVLVRANGTVTSPIRLPAPSNTSHSQSQPQLAFNGTQYLVVWTSYDGDYDIQGARVSAAGVVLDVAPRSIADAVSSQYEPAVTAHGDFVVTWTDYRNGGGTAEIRAARVAADGTVRDPAGKVVISDFALRRYSRPLYDGSGFVVLWQEGAEAFLGVRAARLSADLAVVSPAPVQVWHSFDSVTSVDLALLAPHQAFIVYQRFDSAPGVYMNRVHGRRMTLQPLSGGSDAGTPDAGTGADGGSDAGSGDAGSGDAGSGADAGDSGPDAGGPADAGGGADGGVSTDAGTGADAGSGPPPAEEGGDSDSGCGCSSTGVPFWGFLPLALLVCRRRSRAG